MAISVDQLVRELRGFDGRREIVKAIGKGVRAGVPAVRKAIRQRALDTLPSRNGVGTWVAKSRITPSIKFTSRAGSIKLKGTRNSIGAKSDLKRIDAGRVRAPSWGHRTKASWHTQTVKPGFFTETAAAAKDWHDDVDRAVDEALDTLRRG